MKVQYNNILVPSLLKVGTGTLNNLGIFLRESGFSKVVVYFGNNFNV